MSQPFDVLILGGGVIGLTTADQLAGRGFRVGVLDRGAFGQEASWAGAGIIPPGNPAGAASPYDRLRAESSARFPALSAELRERTGIDNGYRVCGGIEFLSAQDKESITAAWQAEGVPFERVSAAVLQRWVPSLQPPTPLSFSLPSMAQVRNPWHLCALRTACEQRHVVLRGDCPARGFRRIGERITGVITETESICADAYVITAGAWTDELLEPLGVRLGVRPVRGQIVLYQCDQVLFRQVLLVEKRYLVPREDGRVLVGSTEEDAGFHKATTPQGIAELRQFAEELVPALRSARVETSWAGLRPGSPDGLPLIGRVPGIRNLIVAAGHFRAGIQLSPATAERIVHLLEGGDEEAALALDRSPQQGYRPAFRS